MKVWLCFPVVGGRETCITDFNLDALYLSFCYDVVGDICLITLSRQWAICRKGFIVIANNQTICFDFKSFHFTLNSISLYQPDTPSLIEFSRWMLGKTVFSFLYVINTRCIVLVLCILVGIWRRKFNKS